MFAVQDDVVQRIVSELRPQLSGANRASPARVARTDSVDAYDLVLRGRELMFRYTREAMANARTMFSEAAELDPYYAGAQAHIAITYLQEHHQGWSTNPLAALAGAYRYAVKATELDDGLAQAHGVLGHALLWQKRHDDALAETRRALDLDPNDADGYVALSQVLVWNGQAGEAPALIDAAMLLNPFFPFYYNYSTGFAAYGQRDDEQAIVEFRRTLQRNPDFGAARFFLAASLAHLDRAEEAQAEMERYLDDRPELTRGLAVAFLPFREPGDTERLLSALEVAGVSD